jgi:acyl-[acyl carrier protein]--UDP-N-acetylglucosamine O-acyltransferase
MNRLKVLKSQIANELEKMKRLLDEAAEIEGKKASNMTIRTGGSIVHDFYTGAENIFHAIASSIDESVPSGMSWHTELLNQMTLNIEGLRSPIISKDTAKLLDEYLRFRHLFRKRYGFDLEWTNIKTLLKKMPAVYKSMESDLNKAFEDKE